MILVDDQSGSKDLFPYIKALMPEVILTRIDPPFGDIAWYGNGPNHSTLRVGVEYKQMDDLLTCMIDGRFSGHQAIGMVNHYDRRYLLVEMGRFRFDRNTGVLQKIKKDKWWDVQRNGRGFTYRELEHWFTTIEEHAQFRVIRTSSEYESARWVMSKYTWYTVKDWDDHDALKQFHVPPPPTATFVKPGLIRRVAKELNGVGWDRSLAVESHFSSVRQLACASESDWCKVEGIGKTISTRIVREITGSK
jgi:ERCC4-type nuclease